MIRITSRKDVRENGSQCSCIQAASRDGAHSGAASRQGHPPVERIDADRVLYRHRFRLSFVRQVLKSSHR